MVGFDDVVQIFAGPMFCIGRQFAFPLQAADRFRVGAELLQQCQLNTRQLHIRSYDCMW